MRIRSTSTLRATHGTSTGSTPAPCPPCAHPAAPRRPLRQSLDGWGGTVTPQGPKPTASAGCSAAAPPWPAHPARARPASRAARGGAPADDRPSSYVGPPHTPATLSPHRWTIMGGQNTVDTDGQGAGWTKCSGWPHRTDRRLTGFSTTWVGCGRRIGSGRAVGVRGETLRGPGGWRRRQLAGGTSGWRGTCRRLRLGTVAPPKKNDPAAAAPVRRPMRSGNGSAGRPRRAAWTCRAS